MTSGRSIIASIWRACADLYKGLVLSVGLHGHAPGDDWLSLQHLLGDYLGWADLSAASTLRHRATRQRTALPPAIDRPGELAPHLVDVARANPWYARHRAATNSLVHERAAWVRLVEENYLLRKAKAIGQILKDPDKREAFDPLYRLERQRRDAHSTVTNTAEQVQLAMPDVGVHFPFAEYWSRDDRRVRPAHEAMHGFVADRAWEGWPLAVPPCGWGCRCFIRYVARFEARDRGWLAKDDRPKFLLRWPNSLAEDNWRNGRFPEFKTPRFWAAVDLPKEAAA